MPGTHRADWSTLNAQLFGDWVGRVRDRFRASQYVDWADVPDDPPCPYRARLTLPAQDEESDGEPATREVVRGEIACIYEVRCACGKRWFSRQFERVQMCPRCNRAVLLNDP